MANPLDDLSRSGVSVWLDDLNRRRLASGSLADLVAHHHVTGVTTNPTIFAKAIAGGDDAYAGQLHDLWVRGTSVEEALRALTGSPRWAALAAAGARPQRPLWASTSVKDPAYPDTRYVTELVAPGVVNTMPEATLRAVADHGQVPADSVRGHYQDARQVLSELQEVGIDYDDVTSTLEDNGLATFDASWRELSDQLVTALRHPREGHPRESQLEGKSGT